MSTGIWLDRNINNVVISGVQDGHVLMYDVADDVWKNQGLFSSSSFFPHDLASTVVSGYSVLLATPPTTAEDIDTASVTSAGGEVLIDAYVTDEEMGMVIMPGGAWHIVTWGKVDTTGGTNQIIVKGYLRDSVGNETLLGTVTHGPLTTTVAQYEYDFVLADTICNVDDRLVIKYYAKTTSIPSRTISFYHDGNEHYSHVHAPFTFGGSSGVTTLNSLSDVVITSATDGQVLAYDSDTGNWINDDASGGGHTIVWSGGALPQRTNLRFANGLHSAGNYGELSPAGQYELQNWVDVRDDPATDTTWISISGSFLGLTDTPDAYAANSGEFIKVNANADGLAFSAINPATTVYQQYTVTSGTSQFTMTYNPVSETAMQVYWNGVAQQHDHFSYTGTTLSTDFVVNVGDEFWVTYLRQGTYIDITEDFLALSDTPNSYTGQADKVVVVNDAETALEFIDATTIGATTFLGLTDTPDSYDGYTNNEIVQVSGTVLNFTHPNLIGYPMADLRKITNVNARNCEFLGSPTFSGWAYQASSGTPTVATVSGWVAYTGSTPYYNINYDVPSHLVMMPGVGTNMKFYTQWSPPPYTNWAVAAKVGINNARHSNDSIQLTASTYGPSAASNDPTHGVTLKLKHNGINNDITSYYHNGGALSGALTLQTNWAVVVYFAILCNAAGELHGFVSVDGINWTWMAIWNNSAYVFNTQGISHVWIATVETAGATNTAAVGTVDWVRFLEGSNNLWEFAGGR